MNYSAEYKSKLCTAAEAVSLVKSGDWVDYSSNNAFPQSLDAALAQRRDELFGVKVRGNLLPGPIAVVECDAEGAHFTYNTWHCSAYERRLCDRGRAFFTPMLFRNMAWYYKNFLKVDVAMVSAAPMDRHGYFNLSGALGVSKAIIDRADTVIIEVNEAMPRICGGQDEVVHISQVDRIVEAGYRPLWEMKSPPPTETDMKIAQFVFPHIRDGATVQLGIGGMPNTVGALIAESDLKDLGVHTEMYVDAFVDIAKAGKINGKNKTLDYGRQVFAFAAGTKKLYDYVNKNPDVMGAPVDYTNDVHVISQLDKFISINNIVDLDLFGQVNAESAGIKHISGTGGQLDFVMGAYLSKGGKSFICLSSAMKGKDGQLKSRIVPTLTNGSICTDPRSTIQYLVTEYGMINLKGLNTWQRAEQIISIAHPQFRDELIKDAEKMGIWRKSNKR